MQIPLLLSAISHLYINVSEFIRHLSHVNLEEGSVRMNSVAAETWGRLSISSSSMDDNLVYCIVSFKGNAVCI